jgi:hypothetical protein
MVKTALTEVEKNFVGLVVGNQEQNFSGRQPDVDADGSAGRNRDELDLMAATFSNRR